MGFGGSPPSVPQAAATPTPKAEDKAIQDAAAEAARKNARGRGFRSTILSKMMPESAGALKDTLGS